MVVAFAAAIAPLYADINPVSGPKGSDANIIGHVVDAVSGEHIPFVSILLKGTNIIVSTDATGHYFMKNLPEGDFDLEASAIGYSTVTKKVSLRSGVTLQVDFSIAPQSELLDGASVTAKRYELTKANASALISIMDSKIFARASANSLSQGLVFQPGVRVETNCQNCGFQQVRINGLEGPYTQILIDSRPVFSALAGVYGLEQIPASMVERVEVLRGSGSALSGSSAIAGTINIVTKEPVRNTGEMSHTSESIGLTGAMDHNTSLNLSLVTDDHKAGMYIFGQHRQRDGYDYDGDAFTEIPELRGTTLGVRSFFKTTPYSKLSLEYHHIEEYRRGGDKLNRPPFEASVAEQTGHSINCAGVTFDWMTPDRRHMLSAYTSGQFVNRDSYYGPGEDPLKSYGHTDGVTAMAGTRYSYHFNKCLIMPADLTVGAEYTFDSIKDDMQGYDRFTDQKVHVASLYAQNEWKNDRWGILLAVRGDKHSMLKAPIFSPRVNLKFIPVKGLSLRGAYSAGFRAPQVFDEDLHISNVGGEISMIVQAQDLREERSNSFSLSADYTYSRKGWQLSLMGEGFFTMLDDVFSLRQIESGIDGVMYMERYNGPGANVYGLNLEGSVAYSDIFQIQAGATLQRSRYAEPQAWADDIEPQTRMLRTPDVYGYFTAMVNPVHDFSIALTGTYTGSMLVPHFAGYIQENVTELTPDFFDMGIKLSYDFHLFSSVGLQLNAGMKNIFNSYQSDFDIGPDRDSGYIYGPSLPRSAYFGVKVTF